MKRIVLTLIATLFISGLVFIPKSVNADASDSEIAKNCIKTQKYLENVLRPQDLRARVTRVQYYDYVYQQLDYLAQRLEHNSQPGAKEMRAKLDTLQKQIDQFVKNYETYDKSRDKLVNLESCSDSVEAFKTSLSKMRKNRAVVAKSTKELKEMLASKLPAQMQDIYETLLASGAKGGL